MKDNYLTIKKIDSYNKGFELGNLIWEEVMTWDKFAKWTIGQQLVRSADSISANIAEGFGRYHKKDKIKFYRYSFGSMEETKDWVAKAIHRKVIDPVAAQQIEAHLNDLPRSINHLIKFTNEKLKF